MNVLDIVYSPEFIQSFDYVNSDVSASFLDSTDKITFTLGGLGLKPDFAYQVKLEGLPTIDPVGNQNLMTLGRRWGDIGYLIFGYLVTDKTGTIVPGECAAGTLLTDTTIPVDSSYHVLWKVSQRARTRSDGPIITHTIEGVGVDGIYGEWETGKPKPGKLALPAHTYTCLLRLTEESFHSTDLLGGNWESVLDATVTFTITARSGKPPKPRG
ncbi:MAG: hypothetical protein ACUVX8_04540 [Candidatus Zipacnadales bacterium]